MVVVAHGRRGLLVPIVWAMLLVALSGTVGAVWWVSRGTEDDGVGTAPKEGIGLLSTRERLEAIGGGLSVRSKSTIGTLFTAWVPCDGISPE